MKIAEGEERNPDFAHSLNDLQLRLGNKVVVSDTGMKPFLADESRASPNGRPLAVVIAETTADVSTALAWANRMGVPVSVRGAGTGLSGGAVAYRAGLVISLASMNRILSFSPENRMVEVQAGVVTADVDALATQYGLMYAPDPASYRTSTIGGNIATNAGGLRCVKYGVTADSVSSVEVVLADGTIHNTGTATRKNAAGLNVTGLLVGSEGTLGVITSARLRLVPRPKGDRRTFRASFDSMGDAAASVTTIMSTSLSPEVLELLDRDSVKAVENQHPNMVKMPGNAVLLGQFIGVNAAEQVAEVESLLLKATTFHVSESDDLLEARRFVSSSLSAQGLRASCDIAVPLNRLEEIFAEIGRIAQATGVRIPTFAHAGDGNLHPGITLPDGSRSSYEKAEEIMDQLAEAAQRLGGTVTGEHGIGSLKTHALARQLSPETRDLQLHIKRLFDPNNILSPGRGI